MNDRISVVGIGGSLSRQSASLAALKIALEGAARAAQQFAAKVLTTPDVERAEAQIQPITEAEASSS